MHSFLQHKLGILTCSSIGTCIIGLIGWLLPLLQLVAVMLSITLSILGIKAWYQARKK